MKYYTTTYYGGTFIDEFNTYKEAAEAIMAYEARDKDDDTYEEDYYQIVDENHNSIGDYCKVIDEWIERGGVIDVEKDFIFPHPDRLYTTDDDELMHEMYAERDEEYSGLDEESFLREVCRNALAKFVPDWVDELMDW